MSTRSLLAAFQDKLEAQIAAGTTRAGSVIARIENEVPRDYILNSQAVQFGHAAGRLLFKAEGTAASIDEPLHHFARSQVAERAMIPLDYLDRLEAEGPWGVDTLLFNLNQSWRNRPNRKVLYRSVNNEGRGVLSDKFKRLDSRPIIDAFIAAVAAAGAQPLDGVGGDTRFSIRAVVPRVYQVFDGEVIAFGVSISNSDFGNGALSIRVFVLRVRCYNLAVFEEAMREVHLGKRISAENMAQFSQATINAETKATALIVGDIIKGSLDNRKVEEVMSVITAANAQKVEPKAFFATLRTQMGLLKSEVQAVQDAYIDGGVEELPPGNSLYRMSNAVSWVAQKASTPERRMELETVAGRILLNSLKAA